MEGCCGMMGLGWREGATPRGLESGVWWGISRRRLWGKEVCAEKRKKKKKHGSTLLLA
jgi:hypothetical protein